MLAVLEGSNRVINVLEDDLVVSMLDTCPAPLYRHISASVHKTAEVKGRTTNQDP